MTKRGKVLREPASGPGLLMLEGQQYRFSREDVRMSDTPPKPGSVVDVELDAQGRVQAITPVPASELAKERAEAEEASARQAVRNHPSQLVMRIGLPRITAAALLAAAWVFLPAVSVQVPFPGKLDFTFWQILGFLNSPGHVPEFLDGRDSPGAALWGFVALVSVAGPFLHQFWNDRRAYLGGLLPLAFLIGAAIAIRGRFQGAIRGGIDGTFAEVKSVSLGSGIYLSIVIVLYFAFTAASSFVAARAGRRHQMEPPQQKAA